MDAAFPLALPTYAVGVLLAVWAGLCLAVAASRHFTTLASLMLVAGLAQASILAATGQLAFQFVDDVPAVLLVLSAVAVALTSGRSRRGRSLALVLVTILVVVGALVRSPDLGAGLAQARQVLLPTGLIFAGYTFVERIAWPQLLRTTLRLGVLVTAWMLVEFLLQRPLIDPSPAAILQLGTAPPEFRLGLPSAYYADGIVEGRPWFRPGGPFMNPPTAGFFLGLVALATVSLRSGTIRFWILGGAALALLLSIARAGLLIFAAVVFVRWAWQKAGKPVTVLGVFVGAYLLFDRVAQQGATGSHVEGLATGFATGVTTIVGSGFGSFGYLSDYRGAEGPSESLLGLYFGWMGVPILVLVVGLAWQVAQGTRRLQGGLLPFAWFAAALLVAAALSETASALSANGVAFLLVGYSLALPGRLSDTAPVAEQVGGRELWPTDRLRV